MYYILLVNTVGFSTPPVHVTTQHSRIVKLVLNGFNVQTLAVHI